MRNLKKIYFLLFFLSFLILSSCEDENTLKIKEEQFKKTYYLSSDSTNGYLEVDLTIEFLVAYKDTAVLHKIQNQINKKLIFIQGFSPKTNRELLTVYANFLEKEYVENNLDGFLEIKNSNDSSSLSLFDHEFSLKSFFYTDVQNVISYGVDSYSFTGGAHGSSSMLYSNYNLRTGELITENELFLDNTKEQISELLKEQLIKQNDEIDTEDDMNERFWTENIAPNGNFYFTKQGITYVFNPYEIAPYFMGIIEIELPFAILRGLIKKNSLVKDLL